jgi:sugar lactone lactonase YvrE
MMPQCALGEGPFGTRTRELFWFDILSKRLHIKDPPLAV